MTPSSRLRYLGLAVAGATALLLAAARWSGRPWSASPDAAGRVPVSDAGAARAGAAGSDPGDLSFYVTLGKAPAKAGHGQPPADRLVRPADETPAPAGAYVVLAIGTRDPALARRVRDRLAGKGLQAVLVEDRAGAVPVYRVRLGGYRDRPAAEAAARRLRTEAGLSPWVLQEVE